MMERDIRAVLDGHALLVDDTEGATSIMAMRNSSAIMTLCADFRRSAAEYNGSWNITMVIGELENHMAAVAGLFPQPAFTMGGKRKFAAEAIRPQSPAEVAVHARCRAE